MPFMTDMAHTYTYPLTLSPCETSMVNFKGSNDTTCPVRRSGRAPAGRTGRQPRATCMTKVRPKRLLALVRPPYNTTVLLVIGITQEWETAGARGSDGKLVHTMVERSNLQVSLMTGFGPSPSSD